MGLCGFRAFDRTDTGGNLVSGSASRYTCARLRAPIDGMKTHAYMQGNMCIPFYGMSYILIDYYTQANGNGPWEKERGDYR
jgi:hypothetical protein